MSQDSAQVGAEVPPDTDFQAIQQEPQFQELKKRYRSFVLPMSIVFLLWYFLYVLLADYAHEFMATRLFGNINVGLVLGLLQFVSTFGITMWYVSYSNRKLDPIASEIRDEIESPENTVAGEGK